MGKSGSKDANERLIIEEVVKRTGKAEFMEARNSNQCIDMCEWDLAMTTTSGMVADTIQSFAAVRAREKKFLEAEQYNEEALPMLEKSFGKDHAVVAECLISVGVARISFGRLADTLKAWKGTNETALRKYKDALGYFEKALGFYEIYEGDNKTYKLVVCHNHLGETHILLGNADAALASYQTAMDTCKKMIPIPQNLNGPAEFGFAIATFMKGEETNNYIIQMLEAALRNLEQAEDDKLIADCHLEIGKVHTIEDAPDNAWEHFKIAVDIRQKLYGDHEETADAIIKTAEAEYSKGDYATSMTSLETALAMYNSLLGHNNPKYASTLACMGLSCYSQPSRLDNSMEFYEQALKCYIECLHAQHFAVGDTYNSMGSVRFAQKATLESMQFYEKALDIYVENYGQDHGSVAISYNNMGAVRRLEHRLREAAEFYKKSLDIRSRILGQDHKNTGLTMNALGEVELERKQYNEAMAMFTQSRFIMAKSLGPDHPTVARVTSNMGEAAHGRGQYAAAMQNFTQSLDIRKKHLGEYHPDVIATLKAMELVQKQMTTSVAEIEKEKVEVKKRRSEVIQDRELKASQSQAQLQVA